MYTEYVDPAHNAWQTLVVPVLKRMPRSLIMERTGLARSSITEIRNGHAVPHPQTRKALTQAATDFARASLLAQGVRIPCGDLSVCMAYLHENER